MSRDIKRFTVIMEAFRPDSKMGHDEVRRVVEDAVRRGHGDELPLVACELGNLEALKMTLEAGCHLTSECTVAAMRVQNFAMIFFLQERENGGLDSASCAEAAFHGRMHILQNFFRGRVDAQAALRAAEGGQLLALRYAHENGVELNGEMAMRASERGHVNCLKFILAYGVELTSAEVKRCGLLAVNGGHIGVLEVLQNHRQFMWTEKFCVAASRNGDVRVRRREDHARRIAITFTRERRHTGNALEPPLLDDEDEDEDDAAYPIARRHPPHAGCTICHDALATARNPCAPYGK